MANPIKTYIRNYIESSIQDALLKEDLGTVRLWLSIAGNSGLEPLAVKDLLKMSFLNGENLTQSAINRSNELLKQYRFYPNNSPWYHRLGVSLGINTPQKLYLLPSQSIVKNLMLLESTIEQPNPKPNLWARFVAWVSHKLTIDFNFSSEPVTVEKVTEALSNQGILAVEGQNTTSRVKKANIPTMLTSRNALPKEDSFKDSLSEQNTPTELLSKPKLIKGRLGISLPSRKITATKTSPIIPDHLFHLVGKAKTTQVIAVDQLQEHQQVQQLNQQVNMVENNLLQLVRQQVKQYVDDSTQNKLSDKFITAAKQIKEDIGHWLDNYVKEFIKLKGLDSYYGRGRFKISQTAAEVLERGNMVFEFTYQHDIDTNKLPLGFFIDEDGNDFVLKFSEELRKDQLKDPLNSFRLDPASISKEVAGAKQEKETDEAKKAAVEAAIKQLGVLKKAFDDELASKNINSSFGALQTLLKYAQQHKTTLDVWTGSGQTRPRYTTVLPSLYKQLQVIASKVTKEHFLSLMIQLEKLSQIPSIQYCNSLIGEKHFKGKSCTLLDHFLGAYFPDNEPQAKLIGEELCQEEVLSLLNHLTHPDNQLAQRFFAALLNSSPPMLLHKAYYAAMAAQEHFQAVNIPVNEGLLTAIAAGGCKELENIINLSSASSVPALQIELALDHETPDNTVLCSRLLNQGYSFVVSCMDLSRYSGYVKEKYGSFGNPLGTITVPMCVNDSDITSLNFGPGWENKESRDYNNNPYFIAWFRYLAYQVDPQHVPAAISYWRAYGQRQFGP